MADRALSIPVILGTPRRGRMSAHVAALIMQEVRRLGGVETALIDVADLPFGTNDAGESLKDPAFSEAMNRADALILVSPEYNHAYPGLLKHALDTNLKEYVHKAAGVVGVSSGPFGGTRGIESFLPVLRELGLVTIFWDVNVGLVHSVFDEDGTLLDEAFRPRIRKFLAELLWMATTLRYGRDHVEVTTP